MSGRETSGKAMDKIPARRPKNTCPKCGDPLLKDFDLGDSFCPNCGLTIDSITIDDYVMPSLDESAS